MDSWLRDMVRAAISRCASAGSAGVTATIVMCAIAVLTTAASVGAAQRSKRPSFDVISRAVDDYFRSLTDYRPGDLVTQSHLEGALAAVRNAGWDVPETERVVKLAVPDGSFLAKQLTTSEGRKFMRNISRHSGAYARLDRLGSIPRGQKIVRDLIGERDGHKFIEYLATTPGGHNLGSMLAGARRGVDLNKPTGRIYTAADLLAELTRVYAQTERPGQSGGDQVND